MVPDRYFPIIAPSTLVKNTVLLLLLQRKAQAVLVEATVKTEDFLQISRHSTAGYSTGAGARGPMRAMTNASIVVWLSGSLAYFSAFGLPGPN